MPLGSSACKLMAVTEAFTSIFKPRLLRRAQSRWGFQRGEAAAHPFGRTRGFKPRVRYNLIPRGNQRDESRRVRAQERRGGTFLPGLWELPPLESAGRQPFGCLRPELMPRGAHDEATKTQAPWPRLKRLGPRNAGMSLVCKTCIFLCREKMTTL